MATINANPNRKRAILVALVLGVPLVAVETVNFISELLDSNEAAIVRRPLATVGVSRAGVFAPNGHLLLTADQRDVHTWDASTWRELSRWSPPFVVNSAVLSADGARLAILGDAQTWVLNREDARVLAKIPGRVEAAAFLADGAMLQTFSRETAAGTITTWDLSSSQVLRTLRGPTTLPKQSLAAFSSDGTQLAVVSTQQNIVIRSTRDGADTATLTVPTDLYIDSATALHFSPDRSSIVVVGPDETARILDAASGHEIRKVSCGPQALEATAAAFSADGTRIALACNRNTGSANSGVARVFDLANGELLFALEDAFDAEASAWIAFSPDGTKLATPDNIWNIAQAAKLQPAEPSEPMIALEFSADCTKIFGAGQGAGGVESMAAASVRAWNAADGHEIGRLTIPMTYPGVRSAAFSPDHSKVLLAKGGGAQIFNVADGKLLYEISNDGFPFHDGPMRDDVGTVAFSPDGSKFVTGEAYGGVHAHLVYVWDAVTGRRLRDLDLGARHWSGALFSPDGARLVVGIDDEAIAVLDAQSGKQIYRLDDLGGHGLIHFSVDGANTLMLIRHETANGTEDVAQIRDAATGKLLHETPISVSGFRSANAAGSRNLPYDFSPDGSTVLIGGGGGSAGIWDTVSGAPLQTLEGHLGPISAVGFSHNGSLVLTAGEDHTVRLWLAADARLLQILEGPEGPVESAGFSPDDAQVIATTSNHRIWLWDTQSGHGRELQP